MTGVPLNWFLIGATTFGAHMLGAVFYGVSGLGERWYIGHRGAPIVVRYISLFFLNLFNFNIYFLLLTNS